MEMEIEETFQLLDEGDTEIVLDNDHRDNIIVLGNTGSGKSTLVLFVAGDDRNLVSEEKPPGSGNFVIVDNDKIGNTTLESKTVFPNLIIDPETDVGYYDCPGFLDTRNSSYDIASTYFTKKVIDFSKTVKLVFVVNHSSVKMGNERQDFPTLVRHVATLVKNITKYTEGIGLVATKVESKYITNPKTKQLELVPDDTVISTIGSFLKEFKTSVTNGKIYQDDPTLRQDALKLADVLLYQVNSTYPRIAIFREPNEAKPLHEIELMQENKRKLKQLFEFSLNFVAKADDDFGYTISDKTQTIVTELAQEINERIKTDSIKIGEEIQKYYNNQIELNGNLYKLLATLEAGYNVWFPFVEEAEKISNPQEYVDKIIANALKTKISISDQTLQYLVEQGNYFRFFEEVSGNKQAIRPLAWVSGMKSAVNFLQRSKNWYSFLTSFFDKLSTFEFQEETSLYNVNDVNDWGKSNRTQGIKVRNDNVKIFLEKLSKVNIDGYKNIKNLTDFSDFELRDLNNVLDVTLIQQPVTECTKGEKLVVRGNFVKITDVAKSKCDNIKKLEIFALNSIFFDGDLERNGNELQVGIIAPTWQVTKEVKITLNGNAGTEPDKKPAKTVSPSGKGKDGNPGSPGKNAGVLFGIGKQFVAGKKLTIESEGGTGGKGQEGGDGGNGNRGADAELPAPTEWMGRKYYNVGSLKFRYKLTGQERSGFSGIQFATNFYYDVYGDHADGGNGGDGGAGGLGGNGGNITVISFIGSPGINEVSKKGSRGKGNVGGKGGSAGRDGDTIKTTLFQPDNGIIPNSWKVDSRKGGEMSSPGKEGAADKNDKKIAQPGPPVIYSNPYDTIIDYKMYVRDNLKDPVQQQPLTKFLEKMEGNNKIQQLYSTLSLTYELLSLENQFYKLTREINVLPLYESIKKRISDYAANPLPEEKSDQYKKVLSYIYSATLSKICSLNNSKDGNLIIDTTGFLRLVKENINKLNEIGKQSAINQYRDKYKSQIDTKVVEAFDFIENKIKPEIDNIGDQIDANIDTLIKEVIALVNSAHAKEEELRNKRKELQKAMSLKLAFGILGVVGQGVGFLGPWGKAVGGVIDVTASVGSSFVMDEKGNLPVDTIPKGVTTLLDASKKTLEGRNAQKLKAIKQEIDKLNKELKKYPDQLNDLESKLNAAKEDADKIEDGGDTTGLENKLVADLKNKKKQLEGDEKSSKEKVEGSIKIIDGAANAMKVVQTFVDVFKKYTNNEVALDEISKAIEKQTNEVKKLMKYQKDIDNVILPLVDGIKTDIDDVEKQLKGKSHVALDVTKWQIQSAIRDMKSTLQQFTQGFKVQENLSRSIEKLDDAMDTLINVYDRIQNYQDQQQLAVYIADINSTPASKIVISDEKLRDAINNLDFVIQSGIVYAEYKRAVNGFQQWVFPFADFYVDDFEFPPQLQLNNSIKDLAYTAGKHIDGLQAKLQEYKVSIIKGHDEFIMKTKFNSNYVSSKPFFVWDNENYKFEISQLLSGKQVILNADVLKADDKNSVKFNLVEIHFKAQNETIQGELDSILKHFQVSLTHMGKSVYRCDQRFFVIISESQLINFSFEKDLKGHPLITNEVYDKIKNGDLMLSPYVMWSIQLNKTTNVGYDRLRPYKDLVDVELVGLGKYVSDKSNICSHKLTNYYQAEDTISEVDVVDIPRVQIEENKIKRYRREIRMSQPQTKFVYSAATKTSSPINNIFKWFKTTTESIGNWFSKIPSLSKAGNNSHHLIGTSYDLNSSLILADLLVRKFTNEKFILAKESSLSLNEAQGLVLEIVSQFEEELEKLGMSSEFDPINLQKELMFSVINENYSKISEALCKSVWLDHETETRITSKIVSMLRREVGSLKQHSLSPYVMPDGMINVVNDHRFSDCIAKSSHLFLE